MIVKCFNCKKEFDKISYEIKRYSRHFCSKECYKQYSFINRKQVLITCDKCEKPFYIKIKEFKKSQHHFCSHSCSAKYFNPITKIKISEPCPNCLGKKDKSAKLCQSCTNQVRLLERELKPISSFFHKTIKHSAVKLNSIRTLARKKMKVLKIGKKCKVCGFDIHVEVCHIKSIASFSSDTLLGIVNSQDNLIYLCPNHHYMFDKGLLVL